MKSYMSFGIFLTILFSYIFLVHTENDNFDWNIFKLLTRNDKNIIYSPISLKIILTLLSEGAGGVTKIQLNDALGISNETKTRYDYENIIHRLKMYDSNYDINMDTNIFLSNNIQPMQPFAGKAKSFYNTAINLTNFNDPRTAAREINTWAQDATRGKIRHLVNSGDIENAVMIIVNALYFKGFWNEEFRKNETKYGGFYKTPDEVINVQYMKNTAKYHYVESKQLDASILRIPYKNEKYSFFVLLPKTKAGLSTLIKRINGNTLQSILKSMDYVPIEVHLPKFQFTFKSGFTDILKEYGLTNMFDAHTASFAGIARNGSNLFVTDIFQKAGIEVNEEGSVAFAATEVQLGNKFGEVQYVFNASYPFAFFIQDHSTNTILFAGKVENPLVVDEVYLPNRFDLDNNQQQISQPVVPPLNLTPSKYNFNVQFTSKGFKIEAVNN